MTCLDIVLCRFSTIAVTIRLFCIHGWICSYCGNWLGLTYVGNQQLLYLSKTVDIWSDTYLSEAPAWRHVCYKAHSSWRGRTTSDTYARIVYYLVEQYLAYVLMTILVQYSNFYLPSLLASTTTVHSAKQCQQLLEWAVLSHLKCLGQREIMGFQVILYSLEPCNTRTSWRSFATLQRGSMSKQEEKVKTK